MALALSDIHGEREVQEPRRTVIKAEAGVGGSSVPRQKGEWLETLVFSSVYECCCGPDQPNGPQLQAVLLLR